MTWIIITAGEKGLYRQMTSEQRLKQERQSPVDI